MVLDEEENGVRRERNWHKTRERVGLDEEEDGVMGLDEGKDWVRRGRKWG